MTAKIGLFRVWAASMAMLAAGLLAVGLFTSGAEGQETGCAGQVMVDAGHGGTDSGAVNSKYSLREKDQNLNVAYRLEALLEPTAMRCA